jgi:ATP-binding cassette, subfamily B, bacterial IrtB/YbtQ
MMRKRRFRSPVAQLFLQLWQFAPRKMRRLILKGLVFRMLQAFCLAGVFGSVSLWSHAFATGKGTSSGMIIMTCAAVFLLLLLQFLFAYLSVGHIWLTSFRLVGAIRNRLLRHFLGLPMTFHLSRPKGDLANALTSDLSLVENLLTDGLPLLVHSLSLSLFTLFVVCLLDPLTAGFAILPVVAALPLLFASCRHLARLSVEKQSAQVDASSQVLQWVEGMATVRTFGMLERRRDGFTAPISEIHSVSVRMVMSLSVPLLGFAAVVTSGFPLIVAVTAYRYGMGALSVAHVSAILVLALPLYSPLLGLAQFMEQAAVAHGAMERLGAIAMTEPKIPEAEIKPQGYMVICEEAGFCLSPKRTVFNPVSLRIPERGLTAIVGPSGAGKSTLLHILAGLLSPTSGRILIGGVDVRDIRPDDLDRLVSVAFQDAFLFSGSIRDNIAMGNPAATQSEIEEAAKVASAHAFIEELPEGYDTRIGEAGHTLSGGERQRLSLARAILKDTPIILVDEAEASVDNLTAQAIASALRIRARDRSVIIVTHTLSSIEGVDRIFNLGKC